MAGVRIEWAPIEMSEITALAAASAALVATLAVVAGAIAVQRATMLRLTKDAWCDGEVASRFGLYRLRTKPLIDGTISTLVPSFGVLAVATVLLCSAFPVGWPFGLGLAGGIFVVAITARSAISSTAPAYARARRIQHELATGFGTVNFAAAMALLVPAIAIYLQTVTGQDLLATLVLSGYIVGIAAAGASTLVALSRESIDNSLDLVLTSEQGAHPDQPYNMKLGRRQSEPCPCRVAAINAGISSLRTLTTVAVIVAVSTFLTVTLVGVDAASATLAPWIVGIPVVRALAVWWRRRGHLTSAADHISSAIVASLLVVSVSLLVFSLYLPVVFVEASGAPEWVKATTGYYAAPFCLTLVAGGLIGLTLIGVSQAITGRLSRTAVTGQKSEQTGALAQSVQVAVTIVALGLATWVAIATSSTLDFVGLFCIATLAGLVGPLLICQSVHTTHDIAAGLDTTMSVALSNKIRTGFGLAGFATASKSITFCAWSVVSVATMWIFNPAIAAEGIGFVSDTALAATVASVLLGVALGGATAVVSYGLAGRKVRPIVLVGAVVLGSWLLYVSEAKTALVGACAGAISAAIVLCLRTVSLQPMVGASNQNECFQESQKLRKDAAAAATWLMVILAGNVCIGAAQMNSLARSFGTQDSLRWSLLGSLTVAALFIALFVTLYAARTSAGTKTNKLINDNEYADLDAAVTTRKSSAGRGRQSLDSELMTRPVAQDESTAHSGADESPEGTAFSQVNFCDDVATEPPLNSENSSRMEDISAEKDLPSNATSLEQRLSDVKTQLRQVSLRKHATAASLPHGLCARLASPGRSQRPDDLLDLDAEVPTPGTDGDFGPIVSSQVENATGVEPPAERPASQIETKQPVSKTFQQAEKLSSHERSEPEQEVESAIESFIGDETFGAKISRPERRRSYMSAEQVAQAAANSSEESKATVNKDTASENKGSHKIIQLDQTSHPQSTAANKPDAHNTQPSVIDVSHEDAPEAVDTVSSLALPPAANDSGKNHSAVPAEVSSPDQALTATTSAAKGVVTATAHVHALSKESVQSTSFVPNCPVTSDVTSAGQPPSESETIAVNIPLPNVPRCASASHDAHQATNDKVAIDDVPQDTSAMVHNLTGATHQSHAALVAESTSEQTASSEAQTTPVFFGSVPEHNKVQPPTAASGHTETTQLVAPLIASLLKEVNDLTHTLQRQDGALPNIPTRNDNENTDLPPDTDDDCRITDGFPTGGDSPTPDIHADTDSTHDATDADETGLRAGTPEHGSEVSMPDDTDDFTPVSSGARSGQIDLTGPAASTVEQSEVCLEPDTAAPELTDETDTNVETLPRQRVAAPFAGIVTVTKNDSTNDLSAGVAEPTTGAPGELAGANLDRTPAAVPEQVVGNQNQPADGKATQPDTTDLQPFVGELFDDATVAAQLMKELAPIEPPAHRQGQSRSLRQTAAVYADKQMPHARPAVPPAKP